MECKIKGIVTTVVKSKKNNNQYINLFDLGSSTQYTLVSKTMEYGDIPMAVPIEITASVSPRQFNNDGKPSTVLYLDQATFKK